MNYFPQTSAGSIAQFPFQRTRQWRWIQNQLESGEMILLPDAPASEISWKLSYTDLNATEANAFSALFESCQGQFGGFLFVDPIANLLAWSEDYTQPAWQTGLLAITAGAADPLGSSRAARVGNRAQAEQSLAQTLNLPGDYLACWSVWARSDSSASFALIRDGARNDFVLTPNWTRYLLSGTGFQGASQSVFSMAVAAGQGVEIFGPQVEVQPSASSYKVTGTATGIFPETYFAGDEFLMTSTGPGLFSAEINLISRVQL